MKGSTNSLVQAGGKILESTYTIMPEVASQGTAAEYTILQAPFIDGQTMGEEYEGLGNIRVRKIGAWIDSEITADNIREGHSILGVSGNVKELIAEQRTVKSRTYEQIITPNSPATGITKVTVSPVVYQSKTVNPLLDRQTLYPDSNYDALSSVTVNAIDIGYLQEQEPDLEASNIKKGVEIFNITGTYDPEPNVQSLTVTPTQYQQTFDSSSIDGYKPVVVNAVTSAIDSDIQPTNIKKNVTILGVTGTYEPVTEGLLVTPTTSAQKFTPAKGVDGFNAVNVEAVTAGIDRNIIPSNIKRDVEILGVTGTYTTENLQDKTVDPKPYIQTITYDSTLGYDGLDTVTVNAVTASVDPDIIASNIKKDVEILGVTGTFEGRQPVIQSTVSVEPKTLPQSVVPEDGYDGLAGVNISAVTAAIDPNILAENIKKNISILGVTGSYESVQNNQASKTVNPTASGDIVVTPDQGYDALLKVIVKAVTASIDPNIIPKNIRKNVSILGVIGALEEGGEQKWFDFEGISNYIPINQDSYGEGGYESIPVVVDDTTYTLKDFVVSSFPAITNVSGVMFTQVYGYDNEEAEYNELEQVFINFVDGKVYPDYDMEISIPTQKRYFYPYTNEYGVKGLTIGLDEDDGSERTMKLYLLETVDSTAIPVPVLVNGFLTPTMLPREFNSFRYIKDIVIPAHERFEPKNYEGEVIWNLQDRNEINTDFAENADKPANVYTSGYDINYGEEDTFVETIDRYTVKNGKDVFVNENNIAEQIYLTYDQEGYVELPETFEKQDGSYYYFKFSPRQYYGYSNYYTLASCDGLFVLYLYRHYDYGCWYPGWRNSWSASNNGSATYTSSYAMYNGNVYYYRVYVNGSSTKIEWSSNGYTWYTLATVTNATYINPTNSNKLTLYVNNEPKNTLYPEGCYVEKDGEIIYKYFDEIYKKETSHCVIPLERDKTLFVNRDLNRMIPYYKGNETISYETYNPENKLMSMGHYGYVYIPEGFNTSSLNSWEIAVHAKVPDILGSSNRHIYAWVGGSTSYLHCLWINTSNRLNWRIYSNNGSGTVFNGQISDYQFIVGQDYYFLTRFTGRAYQCIVSMNPDMSNPVVYYTVNSDTRAYSSTSYLVYGTYTKNNNQGIENIYMDEYSYVKTNGEYLWKPLTSELNGNVVDYIDDGDPIQLPVYLVEKKNKTPRLKNAQWNGSLILTNDDEVSNFSPTNYIVTEDKFNPQNKSWEINFKFKVSNYPTRSNDAYFFGSASYDCGILIGTSSKTLHAWLSSNRTSWNIGEISTSSTIVLDTDYYVRMTYDLSTYRLYLSTDGEVYNEVGSKASTTIIHPMQINIGAAWESPRMYLEGSFYLNDCNIEIDGKEWWKPVLMENRDNYEYIISNNPNWTTDDLNNIKQIGIVDASLHSKWGFEYEAMKWVSSKILTFNLEDEDAVLYTEVTK